MTGVGEGVTPIDDFPYSHGCVFAAGDYELAIRRPGYAVYRVGVSAVRDSVDAARRPIPHLHGHIFGDRGNGCAVQRTCHAQHAVVASSDGASIASVSKDMTVQ